MALSHCRAASSASARGVRSCTLEAPLIRIFMPDLRGTKYTSSVTVLAQIYPGKAD